MLRTFALYHLATGHFTGKHILCTKDMLGRNTPEGCASIEGRYDRMCQRVDLETGSVIDDEILAEQNRRIRERQQRRDHAALRIAELERKQARPQRELQLDPNNAEARARLEQIDAQIAALREEL